MSPPAQERAEKAPPKCQVPILIVCAAERGADGAARQSLPLSDPKSHSGGVLCRILCRQLYLPRIDFKLLSRVIFRIFGIFPGIPEYLENS